MILLLYRAVKAFDTESRNSIYIVAVRIRQCISIQNDSINDILIHKTKKNQFLCCLRSDHPGFHGIKINHFDLTCLIPALNLPCCMCICCRNSEVITVNVITQNFIGIFINVNAIEISRNQKE